MILKSISKMMSTVQNRKVIINCIEGNIACGKSTILDYLSSCKNKNVRCLQEPISEWTNMKSGTDLLKLFYEEQSKWTFAFENLVQLSRMRSFYQVMKLKEKNQREFNHEESINFFIERSILSSFNVFTMNSFDENKLTNVEFDILSRFYSVFDEIIKVNLSKNKNELFQIIYIRTNPEVCFNRLKKRNRDSEKEIDLDYLCKINSKYENWINKLLADKTIKVHVIDGNLSQEDVILQIEKLF